MDSIPYLSDLSAPALVGIAVLLLFMGRLVPRKSVQDANANAEHWRQAWEMERRAHEQDSAQTSRMVDTLDLHTRLLESIRDTAQGKRQP